MNNKQRRCRQFSVYVGLRDEGALGGLIEVISEVYNRGRRKKIPKNLTHKATRMRGHFSGRWVCMRFHVV